MMIGIIGLHLTMVNLHQPLDGGLGGRWRIPAIPHQRRRLRHTSETSSGYAHPSPYSLLPVSTIVSLCRPRDTAQCEVQYQKKSYRELAH